MSEEMEIIKLQQGQIVLLKAAIKQLTEMMKLRDSRMDVMQMQINNIHVNNGADE